MGKHAQCPEVFAPFGLELSHEDSCPFTFHSGAIREIRRDDQQPGAANPNLRRSAQRVSCPCPPTRQPAASRWRDRSPRRPTRSGTQRPTRKFRSCPAYSSAFPTCLLRRIAVAQELCAQNPLLSEAFRLIST